MTNLPRFLAELGTEPVDGRLLFCKIISRMNIKTFSDKTGIDYDKLVEDFCGDTALLRQKILSFPSDCNLAGLKKAIKENDEAAVRSIAHRIRKSAEALSLAETARLAKKLEDSQPDRFRSFLEPLEKEISFCKKALED